MTLPVVRATDNLRIEGVANSLDIPFEGVS